MVVREVMVSAVCNTSKQPQLNQGSVEFNVTDEFLNSTRFTRHKKIHNISLTFSAISIVNMKLQYEKVKCSIIVSSAYQSENQYDLKKMV